jgi:SlyX protein
MEFETMTNDRLNDIEIKLAHQDQQISDLNDVLLRQGREIEMLKTKLRHAEDKLQEALQNLPDGGKALSPTEIAARDKPPHY